MSIKLIQQQIPMGSRVEFSLKNGQKISEIFEEIGREHIIIENSEARRTIFVRNIDEWAVLKNKEKTEINLPGTDIINVERSKSTQDTDMGTPDEQNIVSDNVKPEISRKLFEIEIRYRTKLQKSLILELFKQFNIHPAEKYEQVVKQIQEETETRKRENKKNIKLKTPQGYIYNYIQDKGFGFLKDLKSKKYFFHRSAIIDETLLDELDKQTSAVKIEIMFEPAVGPKGPLAIQISKYRTIKELFEIAEKYADAGEYPKAIAHIKKVLEINYNYPEDNLFISVYQKAGQYEKANTLLEKNLKHESKKEKKAHIIWQIANAYLYQKEYLIAEQKFGTMLKLHPENIAAKRNIGLCMFRQEKYAEAENILNKILSDSPGDIKTAQLLEAITKAKMTGESDLLDEIITSTGLSYSGFFGEISDFTQFFLERCEFFGVAPDRVCEKEGEKKYQGSSEDMHADIKNLEKFAKKQGTSRPHDRGSYYLSAAKIILDTEGDRNLFYRYLCRSFASRGDDAVVTGKSHLDVAREWYCEALSVYGGELSKRKDEQDVVNALVRFLFSMLGPAEIPITANIPSINESIEKVINRHPQRDKAFEGIAYLVLQSRYAAQQLLEQLYKRPTLQAMTTEYLKNMGIPVSENIKDYNEFVYLWNELCRKKSDKVSIILTELRFLTNKFSLTTAWLEDGVERIGNMDKEQLFFDLDKQRMRQLQKVFETALELCKQVAFEERERLCIHIEGHCQELLKEIEESPTKMSIEKIHPVITVIKEKINEYSTELHETTKPQLSLRLAIESYPANHRIEVQITVANKSGCAPAESLELIAQKGDEVFFTVIKSEIKLAESLRGGDQRTLEVPLRLTKKALESQTFSLAVSAQYQTRSKDIEPTYTESFAVRLYPETEFEEIENPYAAHAESGIVEEPEMFFGREELIGNMAYAIKKSGTQGKSIIIFGQKRAGKSSVLYHLEKALENERNLLIINLGSIGGILDKTSKTPFLYQLLWGILTNMNDAIEDRVEQGFSKLDLDLPRSLDFYNHLAPLSYFKEIFTNYQRKAFKNKDWQNVKAVLLIDEFSYIYGSIVSGEIPESFMKNWKAWLQENYFNVVLVGQDVMPKFKQRFPNEFGTTQDERVSYLKREDAVKLVDEPVRIGGRQGESRYRERAIDRIVALTAGSPFYIQIICNRLGE